MRDVMIILVTRIAVLAALQVLLLSLYVCLFMYMLAALQVLVFSQMTAMLVSPPAGPLAASCRDANMHIPQH